ncbi:MAG: DUF6326 family protein [Candidatus Methanoperedens sp.]|nr:DUF6326 family protein [Candidatus Methanoperedens sp.]MCZ7369852.1 DUF6326 family protein [Candidatus Methanoperedens sp.]
MLWLFSAVAFLAHQILALLEPGVMAGIIAGEVEGMKIGTELILLFAILFLVPLIMAFLSLILKDSINRWANIIVGSVFAVLFIGVIATVAKLSGEILMTLSTVVALTLIVWYAWKSKQKV